MVDLAPILVIARKLIKENGREVTFLAHNTILADNTQPWEGPADARLSPSKTAKMDAVFFSPVSLAELGHTVISADLVSRSEQIMMVAPVALVNLKDFQEVLDEGIYWKITGMEIFKPGKIVALAYVGVAR